MAAATSRTESFEDRGAKRRRDDDALTPAERTELWWFFQCYAKEIGQRSVHGAMIAAWGGAGGGEHHDPHERMACLVDSHAIAKAGRIRRTLAAMRPDLVVVLFRQYGPRNRHSELQDFGEYCAVADLTDTAERAREELALAAGELREEQVTATLLPAASSLRAHAEESFWRTAGRIQALDQKLLWHRASLDRPTASEANLARARAHVRDIECIRGRLQAELDVWLRAATYDGLPAARCTACASADRETTVYEALKQKLATPNLPKGPARDAALERRQRFIASVRNDGAALLLTAALAYREAKRATS